ncbi:hypothetical protein B0T25DRAFT_583223 [Lasiosphaeria hispida]|uniref:Uncharacterized protein n=1 Tax=Lasiosphaeria hispida TaxID=260671 RepID=A0AAJ0HAC0_9PEZI|nr:hypothetical protein B0T25DRAFT_583223 [Lasiosphaeria hispida]
MLSTKTGALLLLQAAALFSGVAARCKGSCLADDELLVLLRSDHIATDAVSFCSEFLDLPASTVQATVTPTVVASVTETSYVTEATTEIDTTTTTAPAPVTVTALRRRKERRTIDYPEWLPATFASTRVSSACLCLSISQSIATSTATADAVTSTAPVTVTSTATSTAYSTTIATATALPLVPTTKSTKIEIFRIDTGASVGYVYDSSGPAIGTLPQASTFVFTLLAGATSGSALRISLAGTTSALGISIGKLGGTNGTPQELKDSYASLAQIEGGTPPYSTPVTVGANTVESDIWTIDTETGAIGWTWIAANGERTPTALWRVGGRMHPVGSLERFLSATGGAASNKYELLLKLVTVNDA